MDGISPTRTSKIWRLRPHDPAVVDRLRRTLGVEPIVAQLLLNRDLDDAEAARRFLRCPLAGFYEPELLPGVEAAAARLWAAVQDKRRICVYGDYDVDGVTATAILHTCLKQLGGNVQMHIPNRLEDGYGLNGRTLQQLAADGVQVVVTVDCGIASIHEAEVARQLGVELIITDHHEFKAQLPDAAALVHPRLPGTAYPFGGLSGSGVSFKLAWAICKKACGSAKVTPELREFLLDAILLASLGTVADVVPLFDENRIFVRHGLHRLRTKPPVGLHALLKCAKLDSKVNLSASDVGYYLAPRINAAGRLGTARLAVELLTTTNPTRAGFLADYLERQNYERQLVEKRVLAEAKLLAREQADAPALVLANADWHPGLLGIVASRLVDQFAKPVLMISLCKDEPTGRGSGRSVGGFRLHEALQTCDGYLQSHGGHAMAAGFRILPETISSFRTRFHELAMAHFGGLPPAMSLTLDAEVPLSALTTGLLQAMEQLEPYGAANPQPLLLADRLKVMGEPRRVGNGERHLSFRVRQNAKDARCIAFNMADRLDELMSDGGNCSLAFTPRLNEWQGYRNVEIEVRDFQPGPNPRLE